jgi:hypothetical protein
MRPKDLEIMIPDGADPEVWAREHLCVSFGTIVRGEQFGFEPGSQVIIPTLVPKHIGEGEEWMACHWLKNGRCEIHPRKPCGCLFYDCKQTREEGMALSSRFMEEVIEDHKADGLYHRLCQMLYDEDQIAPDREIRQLKIFELYDELRKQQQQEQLPPRQLLIKLEDLRLPAKRPPEQPQPPRKKNWLRPRRKY